MPQDHLDPIEALSEGVTYREMHENHGEFFERLYNEGQLNPREGNGAVELNEYDEVFVIDSAQVLGEWKKFRE
ncbi:MAG: hypothetical protein ABEJ72_02250, partial [Candidatus Aenigmatarchaeota archaeon]